VVKEEKKYAPTEVGFLVNDMLVENFPEIVDINFTAKVEEDFDKIAEGNENWVKVIRDFYTPFKKHLNEKEISVEKQVETSTVPCSHCGKLMLIKFGRMGKFLGEPRTPKGGNSSPRKRVNGAGGGRTGVPGRSNETLAPTAVFFKAGV
jgi:DNA topoisomerase-1